MEISSIDYPEFKRIFMVIFVNPVSFEKKWFEWLNLSQQVFSP